MTRGPSAVRAVLAVGLALPLAAGLLARCTHAPALAAPPAIGSEDYQILAPHGPWVRGLTVPGSHVSCCDESDCRSVDARRGPVVHTTTTGWAPSCPCPAHTPVPCAVLDPFGGAGTSALVADRIRRHATIIDLNPEYRDMARERIRGDAPLLTVVA